MWTISSCRRAILQMRAASFGPSQLPSDRHSYDPGPADLHRPEPRLLKLFPEPSCQALFPSGSSGASARELLQCSARSRLPALSEDALWKVWNEPGACSTALLLQKMKQPWRSRLAPDSAMYRSQPRSKRAASLLWRVLFCLDAFAKFALHCSTELICVRCLEPAITCSMSSSSRLTTKASFHSVPALVWYWLRFSA